MRLRIAILAAVVLVVAGPLARAATRVTGLLAPGTRFATAWFIQDSGQPGPTILVCGGMHGDEPAGAAAAEEIRRWKITRGRLIVIPRLNITGLAAGRRRMADVDPALDDLNRNFPHAGKNDLPRGTPAVEIWDFLRRQKPDWLIDLHEAHSLHGTRSGAVGSSLLPCPSADMNRAVPILLDAVNATIPTPAKKFLAARPPKDSTLARAAGEHLGVRTMIIETTKVDQPLPVRIEQHLVIVRALLAHLKMQ